MTIDNKTETCPCEFPEIEPCNVMCTCNTTIYSYGCDRCCKYGNREQRLIKAVYLVKKEISESLLEEVRRQEYVYNYIKTVR